MRCLFIFSLRVNFNNVQIRAQNAKHKTPTTNIKIVSEVFRGIRFPLNVGHGFPPPST